MLHEKANAQVQGRTLGMAEARSGGGVPCNDQLGMGLALIPRNIARYANGPT